MCYHHQGIQRLGEGLEPVIVDDLNNETHGLELKDSVRWVKAVLWHPEQSFVDEKKETYD